jgi:hypothetical protein
MLDESTLAVARRRIETLMRLIVARRGSPYRAGWRIWSTAFSYAPESTELMWPIWLLWGALTDWAEVKPAEADQAESAMRRAAEEWLALPNNPEAQRAYFERWLYDEMGIERPQ